MKNFDEIRKALEEIESDIDEKYCTTSDINEIEKIMELLKNIHYSLENTEYTLNINEENNLNHYIDDKDAGKAEEYNPNGETIEEFMLRENTYNQGEK